MNDENNTADKDATKRDRSPNFPSISLEAAIELTRKIYAKVGKSAVNQEMIVKSIGYSSLSGASRVTMAALSSYGLLERIQKNMKISAIALKILHPVGASKEEAIKEAAMNPDIFKKILDNYNDMDEETLASQLVHMGFTADGGARASKVYKANFSFAKLSKSDYSISTEPDNNVQNDNDSDKHIKVGDYVQWICNGSDQFESPKRVSGLSDDKEWVFVDGSRTGLPMNQVNLMSPPSNNTPPANPFFDSTNDDKGDFAQERITLDEGPVILKWPADLTKDSVADLEYWLTGLLKRAKRKAGI